MLPSVTKMIIKIACTSTAAFIDETYGGVGMTFVFFHEAVFSSFPLTNLHVTRRKWLTEISAHCVLGGQLFWGLSFLSRKAFQIFSK